MPDLAASSDPADLPGQPVDPAQNSDHQRVDPSQIRHTAGPLLGVVIVLGALALLLSVQGVVTLGPSAAEALGLAAHRTGTVVASLPHTAGDGGCASQTLTLAIPAPDLTQGVVTYCDDRPEASAAVGSSLTVAVASPWHTFIPVGSRQAWQRLGPFLALLLLVLLGATAPIPRILRWRRLRALAPAGLGPTGPTEAGTVVLVGPPRLRGQVLATVVADHSDGSDTEAEPTAGYVVPPRRDRLRLSVGDPVTVRATGRTLVRRRPCAPFLIARRDGKIFAATGRPLSRPR